MTDTELKKIAKVIYAEGGIFSGKNDLALLAIAQCIHDLLSSYKDLDSCLKSAFTAPSDQYDTACLDAAKAVLFEFIIYICCIYMFIHIMRFVFVETTLYV